MKTSISDLFDSIEYSLLKTKAADIVSTERVKEITMRRLTDNTITAPKPLRRLRPLAVVVIAAAMIVVLGTVALAVSGIGGWFQSYFSGMSERELTSGQQQFIEESAMSIGQSMTSGELTITVESALSDDYTIFVKLLIEAPEGSVLDRDNYRFHEESFMVSADWDRYSSFLNSWSASVTVLEDEDGKSNTVSLLYQGTVRMAPGSGFSFRDGEARKLRFEDFSTWTLDGECVLYAGVWSFDIIYGDNSSGSIELISEPIHCLGQRGDGTSEDVLMTSFEVSAIGATCTYDWDDRGLPEALEFIGVEVVMKDGSVFQLNPAGAVIGSFRFKFYAPIVLGEMDYVRIPDGVVLPVN